MEGVSLNFLGIGSGFCPSLGTTSAYYKEHNNLLIIDCGETVFSRLQNSTILNDVSSIYFVFTHTHCDHIGSIGTLIFHLYFIKHVTINIVLNDNMLYKSDILSYLNIVGVEPQMFNVVSSNQLINAFKSIDSIDSVNFVNVEHVKNFVSYGIVFSSNNLNTYYTGDSADKQFLQTALTDKNLFKLYTDCTISSRETTHTQFKYLKQVVPNNLRGKVYCIHLSHTNLIDMCNSNGFLVPSTIIN